MQFENLRHDATSYVTRKYFCFKLYDTLLFACERLVALGVCQIWDPYPM